MSRDEEKWTAEQRERWVAALRAFRDAAHALDNAWANAPAEVGGRHYPFGLSFDDFLAERLDPWVEHHQIRARWTRADAALVTWTCSEWWYCFCGNTPSANGFYPVDDVGDPVDDGMGDMDVTHQCDRCGQLIQGVSPPVVGQRVRIRQHVERFPHTLVPPGRAGTVTVVDTQLIAVKLDTDVPGLAEWSNELHWYQDDYPWFAEQTVPIPGPHDPPAATPEGAPRSARPQYSRHAVARGMQPKGPQP